MPNAKTNCFVDTNVLVYAMDHNNPHKRVQARVWLEALASDDGLVLSPQSINEFYHVSRRRFRSVGRDELLQACERFLVWCTAALDVRIIQNAWLLEETTGYQWFDCLLLSSAIDAGCSFFLSEDLQHDRLIGDLRIVDPFRLSPSDLLTVD
jgi:predicted nucleic acid-binding protein